MLNEDYKILEDFITHACSQKNFFDYSDSFSKRTKIIGTICDANKEKQQFEMLIEEVKKNNEFKEFVIEVNGEIVENLVVDRFESSAVTVGIAITKYIVDFGGKTPAGLLVGIFSKMAYYAGVKLTGKAIGFHLKREAQELTARFLDSLIAENDELSKNIVEKLNQVYKKTHDYTKSQTKTNTYDPLVLDLNNNLKIWQDLNEDGITQINELKALKDLNITSINLNYKDTNQKLDNDNIITQTKESLIKLKPIQLKSV
ncbi:hypothetical protein [Campylobacter canadensis]|uniref:Uncharacterized protein n=1 Tax=Campylobacter canadensis TaxID=449520 RepID=A0ABS7WTQ7_9BACT|nr:hypothetical protein [Campylobacter canadensis]MBZ7988155.1 hypothetical protein [Campylobacter canadensis]MBZ7999154.1 hypothetical protein [Campylobacter canadensis]